MKEQIQEMESELERFHKQNTQLELNITELRQKLKATDKELHQERQRVRRLKAADVSVHVYSTTTLLIVYLYRFSVDLLFYLLDDVAVAGA